MDHLHRVRNRRFENLGQYGETVNLCKCLELVKNYTSVKD